MGQMAVRVALQCSEADAHLILNDERNPAARYLSRPGEAIYNDQNGLLIGNNPFQVVWLSEKERVDYLETVHHLQEQSGTDVPPPIVFEGNAPADPATNWQLTAALAGTATQIHGAGQKAWLGAAVAIKEPTCATFACHAGSNLLVVGHREEAALGVMTAAVISLAAASRQDGGAMSSAGQDGGAMAFHILDGTRPEAPEAGTWQRVADALPNSTVRVGGNADVPPFISQLTTELTRRENSNNDNAPPIYLVIHNAGRFRDLRRSEDDFSFSTDRDKPPSPDKQLAELLKNGPAHGIHTLVWCDSYNNVTRLFDRMALREFEMRVVFQMSAADSTSLLDTPAAAKLVVHRGLFYSDETGTAEKFRPYGPPTDEWLERVRRALDGTDDGMPAN
jgi:hypothetical protein